MSEHIVLFGGAFDPIHNGHLHLAKACRESVPFTKMLLIPSRLPAYKAKAQGTPEQRLSMCHLAAANYPWLEVSDMELQREGVTYTIDTVLECKRLYQQAEFSLLVGSDMLSYFPRWYQYGRLLREVQLIAAVREDSEADAIAESANILQNEGGRVVLLKAPAFPVSSTEIRQMRSSHEDVSHLLPEQVLEYIKLHHLYE